MSETSHSEHDQLQHLFEAEGLSASEKILMATIIVMGSYQPDEMLGKYSGLHPGILPYLHKKLIEKGWLTDNLLPSDPSE